MYDIGAFALPATGLIGGLLATTGFGQTHLVLIIGTLCLLTGAGCLLFRRKTRHRRVEP